MLTLKSLRRSVPVIALTVAASLAAGVLAEVLDQLQEQRFVVAREPRALARVEKRLPDRGPQEPGIHEDGVATQLEFLSYDPLFPPGVGSPSGLHPINWAQSNW